MIPRAQRVTRAHRVTGAPRGAQHVTQLQVVYDGRPVGQLAKTSREEIWFEYDPAWVSSGFALSPFPLFSLRPGAFKPSNPVFDGLHGVFNDALPDGWGRLLMDRALRQALGWERRQITPLDRLAYIGSRAMGALEFRPAMGNPTGAPLISLEQLAEEARLVQDGTAGDVLGALYLHGGSPGGARPKVTLAIEAGGDHCVSGFGAIPDNYEHWIVKFRARQGDPLCMARIEMAYAKMAAAAGVPMPATRLISAKVADRREDFFAARRFDRVGNTKRHVISLGAMLEISHREPCLDYAELLKAVHLATRDVREVQKAFRLMVFNVLAHNKDDHVKNFSFLFDGTGWATTPAYDLTFSSGIGNQHTTSIAGSGNPSLQEIRTIAGQLQIDDCEQTVAEVFEAVAQWERFATEQQVHRGIVVEYGKAMRSAPGYADWANRATRTRTTHKPE